MSKASIKSLYLHFLDEFLSTDDQFRIMLESNALALITELETGKERITRSELSVREIATKLDITTLTYTSEDPIGAMFEAWNNQASFLNEIWIDGECDMERLGPSLIESEWSSSLELQENQSRVMVQAIALSSEEFPLNWHSKLNNCSLSLKQWGMADMADAYLYAQMELKKLEQDWKRLQKRAGLTFIELYKFWSSPAHKKLSQAVTKAEQECEDLCEKARFDLERLEQERLEQERLRIEYEAEERKRKEIVERERQQQERFEQERKELEKFEKERQLKERFERERKELERFEKERLRLEQEEIKRKEFEQYAKEKKLREKLEKEQIERERLKRERQEEARKEAERQLHDRLEREALERKKQESFERAQQQKLQEEKERLQQEEMVAEQAREIRKKRKRFTAVFICILLAAYALGYFISVSEGDSYDSLGSESKPLTSEKIVSTNNDIEYKTSISVKRENEEKSLSASFPPQSVWLQGGLYGHDNPAAAIRRVRITEIQSGRYEVTISNQFGFVCSIDFNSNGNPLRLRACSSANEPSWSVSPQEINLKCEQYSSEVICRGQYELSSGAYSSPSEMVIARKL